MISIGFLFFSFFFSKLELDHPYHMSISTSIEPKLSSQYEEEEKGTPEEKAGPKSNNKTHEEGNVEQVQARDEATFSCCSGGGGGQRRWWNVTASAFRRVVFIGWPAATAASLLGFPSCLSSILRFFLAQQSCLSSANLLAQ